tara:strand:+ start:1186 stop:1458 length:273 start_codon:yes stop_codon:yes gene_type:complete
MAISNTLKAVVILNTIIEQQTENWEEPLDKINIEDRGLFINQLTKEEVLDLLPLVISGKMHWYDTYMLVNELMDLVTKNYLKKTKGEISK